MTVSLCRTTPYSVYSPETYEGHWKQLTVRTTRTKQAMAVAFFHPQVRRSSLSKLRDFTSVERIVHTCHRPCLISV